MKKVVQHSVSELIVREQMFDSLLQADPTFRPAYQAFRKEWAGDADSPQYLALSDLAQHLIGKLERGDTESFRSVFAVVEDWSVRGDRYVKEAAAIGLLEDLQNEGLYREARPTDFLIWLGPRSRVMWDRVEKFWKDGTLIASD